MQLTDEERLGMIAAQQLDAHLEDEDQYFPWERPGVGGWERAEHRAVLPGKHGLECTLYELIFYRTMRLREQVYVTFVIEDGEFRPAAFWEHSPRSELLRYQFATALKGKEMAYGQGRSLEVSFRCYSPKGSGAAQEAVREIGDALKKLREVVTWPERKRSWFGFRYGAGSAREAMKGAAGATYRPPEGTLPYRDGPPVAEERPELPGTGNTIQDVVRGHLERWGMAEDWDRMRAESEQKRTEKLRERRALEELERAANPFGFGPGENASARAFSASRDRTRRARREPERSQWEWGSPWEDSWM